MHHRNSAHMWEWTFFLVFQLGSLSVSFIHKKQRNNMLLMNENNKNVFADREKCMPRILKCCFVSSSRDPSGMLPIVAGVQWLNSVMQFILSSSSSVGNRKLPETKPLREKQAVDLIRSLIRSRVSPQSVALRREIALNLCAIFSVFSLPRPPHRN